MLIAAWGIASDGNMLVALVMLSAIGAILFGLKAIGSVRTTKNAKQRARERYSAPPVKFEADPTPPPADWVTRFYRPPTPVERFDKRLRTVWHGAGTLVEFTYLNQKGEVLRRAVTVTRISQDSSHGGFYLHGICHLRKDHRTFNVENIIGDISFDRTSSRPIEWIARIAR